MTDLLLSSKWGHGNKTPERKWWQKTTKWRISGEIFLASSSPFLPPFFAQIGSLRALAGWRSLISCRDGWLLLLFKDSAWLRERLSKKPLLKFITDIYFLFHVKTISKLNKVKKTQKNLRKIFTDCPATFDTLCEGYYSGVGGPTGQFVVYSGRGRFEVFFEVSWIHLGWWEGCQKSSQKLKNRVFGIFCTPGQMPKSS